MEPPARVSSLSHDDQLSLWVGRVARVHALLEYSLSILHVAMRPPDERADDSPRPLSVDQLVLACNSLLKAADVNPDVIAAGTEALSATKAVNLTRNRIVHDMWLPDSGSEEGQMPKWRAFRRSQSQSQPYASSSLHDLDAVVSAHTTLLRCRIRISGLFMALHELLPWLLPGGPRPKTSQLTNYIALMQDRFTLEANGDFKMIET